MKINALKIFLLFFFLALPHQYCLSAELGGPGTNPNVEFDGSPACSVGMPSWMVNTANLNFIVQDIDLRYSSKGMSVEFIRTYNANDSREGIFGRSWTFNYNVVLTKNSDRSIDIRRGDGRVDHFLYNNTHYQGPKGVYDTLTKNNNGTYSLSIRKDKTTQNFNAQGQLINIKDRNNNTITFTYDWQGYLTTITDPNSKKITLEYNSVNKIGRISLPDSRYASFDYDANNNLLQSTNTKGATSSFTYDSAGCITTITTPHQGTTTLTYSTGAEAYAIKSITDALGNKRQYGTYESDYQVRIIDSRGNATLYNHNSDRYTESITTASGNKVSFEYDSSGSRNKIIDSQGNATLLTYDDRGNATSITDPLNNQVSFTYDSNDNLIQSIDPKGNTYNFTYDANSNLIETRDPDNRITSFTYNTSGQLIRLSDANSGVTEFIYDSSGNLSKMTDPLGKITSYGYDSLGRLISLIDPKGQVFAYEYDGVDHLTKVTYPDSTAVNYIYNCCNLIKVEDKNGKLQFSYDALGRVKSFTNYDDKAISYVYDRENNLITLTYPYLGNKKVNYEYDQDNRLIKVIDWLDNTTQYNYDARGNLSFSTSPGLLTIYKYDACGRLIKLINYNSNTLAITSGFEFSLDSLGNRTSTKRYLPLNIPGFNLPSATYSYNSANQLVLATEKTFEYDDNGNLTKQVAGVITTNLTYNYDNQLTQYILGSINLSYFYDALGNRIKKTSGTAVTKYIIDPNRSLPRILAETDVSGNITAYYIYGLGLISKIIGSNAYFYQYDGLGSTAALTDKTGAVKNKYAYDDFGNLAANSTEIISNPFKYVGKYGVMTDLNELLYMRSKYYNPAFGRFISKGSIKGLNPYLYTNNNPANYIDPSGLGYSEKPAGIR